MSSCISAILVLAIVLVGLLVMLRLIEIDDLFAAVGRLVFCTFAILAALCLGRVLFIGLILPSVRLFVILLGKLAALAIVVFLLFSAIWFVTNLVVHRVMTGTSNSSNRGEP